LFRKKYRGSEYEEQGEKTSLSPVIPAGFWPESRVFLITFYENWIPDRGIRE
jgi:hypothetical protein